MTSSTNHFSTEGAGTPTAAGRFVDVAKIEAVEMLPGLNFQPVLSEHAIVNVVSFAPHTEAPTHSHVEEQIVVVVEGEFDFTLDGSTRTMRAGDIAIIPPWVPHGARTGDLPCRELDVFTPPRATLLDHARDQVANSAVEGTR
ncbi:MAG TPA: cupin domain-containing protein [Pseudonocardiaceae bacterium]|jgi:quercetin dioxygenase-like cupin family protein|nr:cupin domain-containing protein [Pseudonocardiaceae bacterium]